MTQRQIKLVENYIRGIVRKTLNEEAPIDKYLKIKTPEKVKIADEWWRSLSFNEMKQYYKDYFPFEYPRWNELKDTDKFIIWYEFSKNK